MGDSNQELVRRDLAYILRLNAKIHYDNLEDVQKNYNMILQKNLFKTTLGQKYIKRLEQIINKTDNSDQCVLCKNTLDNLSLVCTQCLKKYKFTPAENKNTSNRNKNEIGQQISGMSKQTVSTIKGGLDILSSKISETAEKNGIELKNMPTMDNLKDIKKEDVINMANKSKDTAKKGVEKSVSFWKSLSAKKKIALVAVSVFLIMGIFLFHKNDSDTTPASPRDVLAQVFPESEYSINFQNRAPFPTGMFEMNVGEARTFGNYGTSDTVNTSIYFIHDDKGNSATCYVSEDGRIIGYGNLVSNYSDDYFVRLK